MNKYEYRCTECGRTLSFNELLPQNGKTTSHGRAGGDDAAFDANPFTCGPLRRIWSVAIVWPMSNRGH